MNYSKHILFTIFATVITDSFLYIAMFGALNMESATLIGSFLSYLSIGILIQIAYKEGFGNNEIPKLIKTLLIIWLFWNIFNLIRGSFLAREYMDWKFLFLTSVSFSLVPLTFFLGKNLLFAKTIFRYVLKYLFRFGFLAIPITLATNPELYSRLMIPISLFLLFIPFVKIKWKFLILIVAILSIALVIYFRSNIIKISYSVVLLVIYYSYFFIHKNWLHLIHLALFITPLVLFTLAFTDTYNIFEESEQGEGYTTVNGEGVEENLMGDTRTFLYVEVLTSLNNSGNLVIGEGSSGSYYTDFFDLGGNNRRHGCEVGVLNIVLIHGIIGVVIYFILLFTVSFIAIRQSNNVLSKLLGLYIAFRWLYSFVEEFTQFDLNFYFFWIAIGLVSSVRFRKMTDKEIKKYFESI